MFLTAVQHNSFDICQPVLHVSARTAIITYYNTKFHKNISIIKYHCTHVLLNVWLFQPKHVALVVVSDCKKRRFQKLQALEFRGDTKQSRHGKWTT
jgi:hypothetical protein